MGNYLSLLLRYVFLVCGKYGINSYVCIHHQPQVTSTALEQCFSLMLIHEKESRRGVKKGPRPGHSAKSTRDVASSLRSQSLSKTAGSAPPKRWCIVGKASESQILLATLVVTAAWA